MDDFEKRIMEDIEHCRHAYGGGILMIYFLSGNMEKILLDNLLKHLMSVTPLSNLVRNDRKKK